MILSFSIGIIVFVVNFIVTSVIVVII